MHKTRYFSGSVNEGCDSSLQGERTFSLLSSHENHSSSAQNSKRRQVTVGPPSTCSAFASLSFIALLKSARPATLSLNLVSRERVVVLEKLTWEAVESLGFPRTCWVQA